MKIIKIFLFFFLAFFFIKTNGFSQANPSIAVMPLNAGLVSLGGTLELQITIGNTGISNIPVFKLRPVITVPAIVTILPNIQQTGLPAGWSIVTNIGSQIRICNGTDVIGGSSSRTIFIKVQAVAIGGPSTFLGQINFSNGVNCAVAGPAVSGNNSADDLSSSTLQVVSGCSLGISATAGTIICNSGTTAITATSSASTGTLEYSITGGAAFQTSNVFNNVVAGTYTVSAREVNNPSTCVASAALTITEPSPITLPSVNIQQPTCSMSNAIVAINSATTDLTFSIDGGSFSVYPAGGYLLPEGSHTITAKNINKCTSRTNTIIVDAQPLTPATPVVGTITQPNCTIPTGSVVLNNLSAGTWILEPGTVTGNTTTVAINNLAAGSYSFTVMNATGCSSLPSANVDIVAVAGAPAAPLVTISQPTCFTATGTIKITSPVTGLTFSLDAGAFATYPTSGFTGISAGTHTLIAQNSTGCLSPFTNISIDAQPASPPAPIVRVDQPNCTVSTGTIMVSSSTTGLTFSLDAGRFAPYPVGGYSVTAGIHSLAVQNLSGCTASITNNIVVNSQPITPSASLVFTPITCFGGNSLITASGAGGVLPFEYRVNGGVFQSANVFTVGAGSYKISVKDANGCLSNSIDILITQPTEITNTASASPIACNAGNATLTVLGKGGQGAYEYSLNNGAYQSNNTFNVVAGIYTAKVRLVNNPACSSSVNTIVNVTQPGTLKASAKANAIAVCGGNTLANITATGGTPPYEGTGNFVKDPGNWNFIITDAKGCSTFVDLNILPPGCLDMKVFPNPAESNITINHSAAVGTSSYLQIFSEKGVQVFRHIVTRNNFITHLNISKLSSGNYIIVYINGDEKKEVRFIKIN